MPYMTEELWRLTATDQHKRDTMLALASWPDINFRDEKAAEDINWLIDVVSGIRSARAEMNVPAGAMAPLVIVEAGKQTKERVERHEAAIKRLARIESIEFANKVPEASAQIILGEATFCMPLGKLIDFDAERARLEKEMGKIDLDIEKVEKKLNNPKFVENAKPEIVEAERERLSELEAAKEKLVVAMKRLG